MENQPDLVVAPEADDERVLLADVDELLAELPGTTAAELLNATPEEIDWCVPGLLAPGWTIKIAAREKTGKGTFVFYCSAALSAVRPRALARATAGHCRR
jgi:hypothetical protein